MKKSKSARNFLRLLSLGTIAAGAAFPVLAADKEPEYGDRTTLAVHPEWVKDAVIYEVNLRQGTPERNLKGMQRQLPRLKDLGVDIIWLMPVHPISELNRKGELGSYYAVADYKGVNPEFGTTEDIKEFVRTAHSLGMKVILDEVCNHSGCDNPWTLSNPDFYARDKQGKMYGPFDWTDTYKFDYSNPAMREAMIDALEYWVRDVDIDGYRCDVAGEVPTDFWVEARRRLDKIKPVFMLAESSKPELTLEAFDADYNWPMKDVFNAIAATQGVNEYAKAHSQRLPASSARTITDLLKKQRRQYPKGAINMNMITNHDLNSWEGTEFDRLGPATGAFAVLSYTLPGMPMMYTGQEIGWNKAFEFFKQDSVPDYQANQFTAFYEMLNALKHSNKALNAGNVESNFTDINAGNEHIIAFTRDAEGDEVTVIANLSNEKQPVKLKRDLVSFTGARDWFTGAEVKALPSQLAPWQYVVLVKQAAPAKASK